MPIFVSACLVGSEMCIRDRFGVDLEDRIWLELKLLVSASVGKSMRNVVTQKCWLAVKNEFDTQMTKQRIKMHMRVNNDLNDPSASDDLSLIHI